MVLFTEHVKTIQFRYKSKASIPAVVPGVTNGSNFSKNGRSKSGTGPPGKDSEFFV